MLPHEQGSQEWLDARVGVITGTRLKQVLSAKSTDLMYELLAETLAPKPSSYTSEAMERGSALESDALMLYESTTGRDIESVGLCLHDEHDWLGVSPDGLYRDKKKYVGGIEIKCPDTKTHLKYLVTKKIPSEYKAQVLQQFIVNEDQEWLDFMSYDPRIQLPELQLSIVTITRDELSDEIEIAQQKLIKFREKWAELQDQLIF
jgi:putative phage-type endonuclease